MDNPNEPIYPNLNLWRKYNEGITSPTNWVDLGWLYVVTSALQRRVWFGSLDDRPLFPNLYIVLCGPPATGKGLILQAIDLFLKFHKDTRKRSTVRDKANDPLLIPCGPDAITYEALLQEMSAGATWFKYTDDSNEEQQYSHASMSFVLEELSSLFKRLADNIPKFLLKTYDCTDYEYKTKHAGNNIIKKTCMNFIAGTTPSFLAEAGQFHIFDDGFTSRAIFSFEFRPRYQQFFLGEIQEEHRLAKQTLLGHILRLTKLFGRLHLEPGIKDFLEDWYKAAHARDEERATPKMASYYGRKKVHILKLAAAYHFSDHFDLVLRMDDIRMAIQFLHSLESNMMTGFSAGGRNELSGFMSQVIKYIRVEKRPISRVELLNEFGTEITLLELDSILSDLVLLGKLTKNSDTYIIR